MAMDEENLSLPATLEDLKSLIRSLNQYQVEYLLIGGYALFVHGYHRATVDIDILLPANRAAGEKTKQALLVMPDQCAKEIDPAWFEEGENIRVADAYTVDLMLNACGETYETLVQHAITIDLDGIPVKTVDLPGLLKTKMTSRAKDASDRLVLQRAIEASKP